MKKEKNEYYNESESFECIKEEFIDIIDDNENGDFKNISDRKKFSEVWKHFFYNPKDSVVKCMHCSTILTYKKSFGTKFMLIHLNKKHSIIVLRSKKKSRKSLKRPKEALESPVIKKNKKHSDEIDNREVIDNEMLEKIKSQCGRHTAAQLSLLLGIAKSTMYDRINKEGIKFSKKDQECEFCEMKKNTENVFDDVLFPYLRFDTEKDEFGCCLCNVFGRKRGTLLKHIRTAHRNDIDLKRAAQMTSEKKLECGEISCYKLFGEREGKKFWCIKCTEDIKKDPNIFKVLKPKYVPKMKMCPECGHSTYNLTKHLTTHSDEKKICPHCAKEVKDLTVHLKNVHSKLPCPQCGVLIGMATWVVENLIEEQKKSLS